MFRPVLTFETIARAVFVHRIQRQAVGVEQLADVLARLQHDLVDVLGLVDLGRDQLQLAEEQRLERDAALVRRQLLRVEESLRRCPVGLSTAFIGRSCATARCS